MTHRVVHFEIETPDAEASVRFYREAFGWKIEHWDGIEGGYWLVHTDPAKGFDGGIQPVRDRPRTVNTIEVDSVEEATRRIVAAGGKVVRPKMTIPGIGYHAYCADPTGLIFGLMKPDPAAK